MERKIQNHITDLNVGLQIESLHLTHVTVPVAVKDSYLDVVSAKEDQSTSINLAQEADAASCIATGIGRRSCDQ